jgi:uncharacterized protein involved in exopolysaccharide biosynthesis
MSLTIHSKKSWPSRAGDHMKDLNLKSAADAAKDASKAVKLPAVTKAGRDVAKRAPKKAWLAALAGGVGLAGAIVATMLAARRRDAAAPE